MTGFPTSMPLSVGMITQPQHLVCLNPSSPKLAESKGQPSVSFTLLPSLAVEKFHGWLNITGTAPVKSIDGEDRFTIGEYLRER